MERLRPDIEPYEHDPGHWGASLLTLAELILPCLDAASPRSVVEVGAYAGDLTALLLQWAAGSGARVWAIDPAPRPALIALAKRHAELELVRATSREALPRIPRPDAAIIDGDHNYFTVSEELRLIADDAEGAELPLLMLHDVGWPHGRRDDYYDLDSIPAEHRKPVAQGGLFPGEPGVRPGALPYRWPAAHEGGPRNGVLTAVEDFVDERAGLRLAIVPAFFGLGVVWHESAPWADALADVLEPWDRNSLLERLEANRVRHLASTHFHMVQAAKAEQRLARQESVLRRMLESSAFAVAERLSRLRVRLGIATEHSEVSKEEIRRALRD
jgi:Methyltransferase domain